MQTSASLLLAALSLLGLGVKAPAQAAESVKGIPGTYDPVTRTFTPDTPMPQATPAASPTLMQGTIKIVAEIKIDSKIPSNMQIRATVQLTAQDPITNNPSYTDSSLCYGNITRKGSSGSITLPCPYYWTLTDTKDTISINFSLMAIDTTGAIQFTPNASRVMTISFPKNGTTQTVQIEDSL